MRRRLFNLATILSLVLLVATVAMWVRSYWYVDELLVPSQNWCVLESFVGSIEVEKEPIRSFVDKLIWNSHRLNADTAGALRRGRIMEVGWVGLGVSRNGVRQQVFHLYCPYWLIVLMAILLPAIKFLKRHHSVANGEHVCVSCGYDLRGTPDRCPECGTVPAKK